MSEEQLIALSIRQNTENLGYIVRNEVNLLIDRAQAQWQANQLPRIDREQIVAEDITLAGYIRKQAMLKFIPDYTTDSRRLLQLIAEIDRYVLVDQTRSTQTYLNLLNQKIKDQLHFNQRISETSPGIIYVFDILERTEIYSNRKAEALLGYSHAELEAMGDSYLELVQHPDDIPLVLAHFMSFAEAKDGEVFTFEHRLKDKQGRYHWLRNYESVFKRDEQGRPSQIIGIALDIDQEKQYIDQLRQSEELHKQTQALTHIGNWAWDIKANTISWSDEMYRIYGLEPQSEPISLERFMQLVHPDDRELVATAVQQSLDSHRPNDFFHRALQPDGTIRMLHAIGEVQIDEDGQLYKMIGTGQDVTAQKIAEKRLAESQIFIRKITDATPAIIASYNLHTGQYQFVSEGLEVLLGYSPKLAFDKGVSFFMELIHPDDLGSLMEKNAKAVEVFSQPDAGDDVIVEFIYRMRHQHGDYRWFHTYGTVFDRTPQGVINHVLNISLDITERVKGEQLIAENNRQLEQSNASLKEFAYIASHDLKEPLRKISTIGDLLLLTQRDKLDTDGFYYLEKMVQAAIRMQTMINDVLSVSLIAGNKSFQPCDLQQVLGEVLQTLDHEFARHQAVITTDPLPVARVIPSQFRQLFLNLLANSLKFTRPEVQPQLSITYKVVDASVVEAYDLPSAEYYHYLEFKDNGIGFDDRFAERIFTIFQRLHPKEKYDGTGIGLSICKRVIENHGGIIVASGKLNEGATFTVIFPQ